MELVKLTERIYYLPASEETDRPVLGYIRGDNYSLMIDAGNSKEHVSLFHKELQRLSLPTPDYVAITHWHWDHTFGMSFVTGKVIAGQLTNEQLRKVKGWIWTDEAMQKRLQTGEEIEGCDRHIRLEYPDRSKIKVRSADIEFDHILTLDLGGIRGELRAINATHSEDSVIIYIPEEKVLFVGDADCNDCYNHGRYDKEKLEAYIKMLDSTDFKFYIHGHDTPQTKEETITYLKNELESLT